MAGLPRPARECFVFADVVIYAKEFIVLVKVFPIKLKDGMQDCHAKP
jgi:hypothetical protein